MYFKGSQVEFSKLCCYYCHLIWQVVVMVMVVVVVDKHDIQHNLENSTCDPLKYTTGSPILIVSTDMYRYGKVHQSTKG